MPEITLAQLESLLGLDFISYCTATSKEDLASRFRGERTLPTASEVALGELVSICTQVVHHVQTQEPASPQVSIEPVWDFLGVLVSDANMSLANAIRKKAGGQVFEPEDGSSLVETLQRITANVFPILLIPPSSKLTMASPSMTRSLRSYPASPMAVDAIMADNDLKRLHPQYVPRDEQPADGMVPHFEDLMVYRTTIEALILYTFNKVIFTSLTIPSVEAVCQEIQNSVTTAKNLIQGNRVSLPVAVGLSNLKLPAGAVIDSEIGRLSEYQYIYDRWSPAPLRNKRINQGSDQGQYEFNLGGDIVLFLEQRVRLRMASQGSEGQPFWTMSAVDQSTLSAPHSTVCLAATLAIDYETPIAVRPTWTASFSPLVSGPMVGWEEIGPRPIAPLRVISPAEANAWNDWISRIKNIGLKGVDVAARRIQLAIAERDSAIDRFVDSIIAWENLFGGGSEMTLRISASLAWLLGEDADRRQQIQEEARDLYGLRGRVVHGATELSDADAGASAITGLRIAIDALRKIYAERPQMIPLSAGQRSLSMILQIDPQVFAKSAQK
jgi:hypothetical protein